MTRTNLHKSNSAKEELPQIHLSWTRQELQSLVNLLSRRPAKPTAALIRAMKERA